MFSRIVPLLALAAGALLAAEPAAAQTWRTVRSARQVTSQEPLSVRLEYGAGELRVEPAKEPLLYQLEMRYDEDEFAPVTEYDARAGTLELGLESRRNGGNGISSHEESRATLGLTREVPLSLDLEFGAGEAEIDLGGLSLQRLGISTGASQTTVRFDAPNLIAADRVDIEAGAAELKVLGLGNTRAERFHFQGGVGSTVLDFGGRWDRDAAASVQMGVGSLVLRFPRGLGVKLQKSSFLTSFDGEGLIKRGNSYYSPDWESAPHRLTLDVDAAFGSIEVEWID